MNEKKILLILKEINQEYDAKEIIYLIREVVNCKIFLVSHNDINYSNLDNVNILKDISFDFSVYSEFQMIIFDSISYLSSFNLLGLPCIFLKNSDEIQIGKDELVNTSIICSASEYLFEDQFKTALRNIRNKDEPLYNLTDYVVNDDLLILERSDDLIILDIPKRKPLFMQNKQIILKNLNWYRENSCFTDDLSDQEKNVLFKLFIKHNVLVKRHGQKKIAKSFDDPDQNDILPEEMGDERSIGVAIYLTEKCNLDCQYCAVNKNLDSVISLEEYKKIIHHNIRHTLNQQIDIKILRIQFLGGEPLLYWDVIKSIFQYTMTEFLIEYEDISVEFSISTNLILFNTNMLNDLNGVNVDFQVSLDGIHCKHIENRVGSELGIHDIVLENIKILKKNQIDFILCCVINKGNQHDIVEISKFLLELGSISLKILPVEICFTNPIFFNENRLKEILPSPSIVKKEFIKLHREKIIGTKDNYYFDRLIKYIKQDESDYRQIECNHDFNMYNTVSPELDNYPCPYFYGDNDYCLNEENLFYTERIYCPINPDCSWQSFCLDACPYVFISLIKKSQIPESLIQYIQGIYCDLNRSLFIELLWEVFDTTFNNEKTKAIS